MVRISRKWRAEQTALPEQIYRAGLYVRLSKEDSGHDNKDTIAMQQHMLEQYVKYRADMQIAGVFCDNGATGTNFARPGFKKMMEAARKREINCIVVKDLSRLGRDYVEAGYYLEHIFPFMGIRFIAMNDGYDTLDAEGSDMVVSLKNIVNALFAKDISHKASTALKRKQEQGEFIGARAPYGYLKSQEDRHKLVIDPESAPVVREIFAWRRSHDGYTMIARRLNERNVLSPHMRHYLRGEYKHWTPSGLARLWQGKSIKSITDNMVYAGHMVQGKTRRSLCEGILQTETGKKEWAVVYHTHEAIVDEDTFAQVQRINRRSAKNCEYAGTVER